MVLLVALCATGCKKDKKEPENKLPTVVGTWSHVRPIGSFRNILTEIQLKADGSGNEFILNITTGSSNTISDLNFKWTVESSTVLSLKFDDGSVEKYDYVLNAEETRLTLTSESGDSKEYIRQHE